MTFNEISAPSVREIFVRCYKPICRIEAHGKDRRPRKVKVSIYFTAVGMFTLPTEMEIQAAKDEIRQSPQQFKLSA